MSRGRPPKPRETKKAEGTYRPDRDYVPPVVGAKPSNDPPKGMRAGPKAVWLEVWPQLVDAGLATSTDRAMFEMFCETMSLARELRKSITTATVKRPSGMAAVHPAIGSYNATVGVARQLAEQFGLTPVAKARIGLQGAGQTPGEALIRELGESPRLRKIEGGKGK